MIARWSKDRRRAQAGTTLVELLVAIAIIGLALVLIVGTFSTGLLDAAVAKRNTATQAVIQTELGRISGSQYDPGALSYSECYKTEAADPPLPLANYKDACPDSTYSLRADVSLGSSPPTSTTQIWTVTVVTWPELASAGSSVSTVKADR